MDGNRAFRLILWLYDRLAGLYPPAFRGQFSAEQREVFAQALEDAYPAGLSAGLRLLAREFADLPAVLARCYWTDFRRGGWKGLLASMALLSLFLVPAVEVFGRAGQVTGMVAGIFVIVGLLISVISAFVLGVPRWTLPLLGFFLGIFSFYAGALLTSAVMMIFPRRDYSMLPLFPRLAYGTVWNGVILILLLAIIFVLFLITSRINPLRLPRLWRHPRSWSDASFLFYGGTLWQAYMTMDEYHHNELVIIIEVAILLMGAYAYMRAPTPWQGVRALLIGSVLAFASVAVGKYFVVPLQGDYWVGWFEYHPVEIERWFESLSSLLNLVWIVPLLLVPATWKRMIKRREVG